MFRVWNEILNGNVKRGYGEEDVGNGGTGRGENKSGMEMGK